MDCWEDFTSVDVHSYRAKLQTYRDQLEEFCTQLDESRHRVCETVRLYEFFDKVRQGNCCVEEGVKTCSDSVPVWWFLKYTKLNVHTDRELTNHNLH